MAISNFTLERIYSEYKSKLTNAKISKIVKISKFDFSFILFSKKQESLIISLEPLHPFFLISSSYFKTLNETNTFVSSLKKYFEGGTIINIEKVKNDRILILDIKKTTPTYQTIINKLIIELIPHRTNAIITDENLKIIAALKTSSSLEDEDLIIKGVHYQFKNGEDKSITLNDTLESLKSKIGVTLYKDILTRIEKNHDNLSDILEEIINSKSYFAYKNDILSINLRYQEAKEITLDQISKIYEEKENEKYKKDHYDAIYHLVSHKLKGLKNKLVKLDKEYQKSKEKSDYVEIGNLLLMAENKEIRGLREIEIYGQNIILDDKLNLIENANKYFKQYQKSKVAINELIKQKELTIEKIDFFEKLQNQLSFASISDMDDIIDELKEQGYIKEYKSNKNKKNKKKIEKIYNPRFITIDGIKIGFGLSSYQNDYLTFTLAKKDDYFLHVKDSHGPHVIIFSSNPSQEVILVAAEIALYLANKTVGEIYLADKKDVKKIPGQLGKVIINNYQTISLNSIRESTIEIIKSTK